MTDDRGPYQPSYAGWTPPPGGWQLRAACAGNPGFDAMPHSAQLATCHTCPVTAECLRHALSEGPRIWDHALGNAPDWPCYGGHTPAQIRNMLHADTTTEAA